MTRGWARPGVLSASVIFPLLALLAPASTLAPAAHATWPPAVGISATGENVSAPVSAAFGATSPIYRVSASGSGFRARNPEQGLRLRFGRAGVWIGAGRLQVGLGLRAIGYGSRLRSLGGPRPSASANGVTYVRSGVREWYRNGPLGLEQGFTIPRAPAGEASGLLTLALALSGNATATPAANGRGLTFAGPGGARLRYGDLLASDARGRALRSWLQLRAGTVQLRVDTRGACYPLRIDPLVQEGGKLVGTASEEGAEGSFFGASVALSAEGDTALVGAPNYELGSAWAFARAGSIWTQQGPKLEPFLQSGPLPPAHFGGSVALSSDGNIALIGDPGMLNEAGAAWVYFRVDSTWVQGPELTHEVSAGNHFGTDVALSADGKTALIGGSAGAAWVFTGSGSNWSLQSQLAGGPDVALSANGETALLGGGAGVSAFVRSGSSWVQESNGLELTDHQESLDFGASLALSANGGTALVGDTAIPSNGFDGHAFVYTRSGSTWTLVHEFIGSGGGAAGFGSSVALSSDGHTALVGNPEEDNGLGAAWVFKQRGSTWVEQGAPLVGGEGEEGLARFGSSVALSADGGTALVGGPQDVEQQVDGYGNRGAVWVFVSGPPSATTSGALNVSAATATLNGNVDPNGLASTAYFEYGTTTAYGQSTAAQTVGASEESGPLAADIGGLAPKTTYHFRVVAESSAGVTRGNDQTFTTAPAPPVTPAPVAPVNRVAPSISGTPIRGEALSVSQGVWANAPTSFSYQWQSCDAAGGKCVALRGASGVTHTLTQGDVGRRLRVLVTAGNAAGSSSAMSTLSPVVGSLVESRMTWAFGWSSRHTVVESLVVSGVPDEGSVEVACRGAGCPFAHQRLARAAGRVRCRGRRCRDARPGEPAEVRLTGLFRGRRLGMGAQIAVDITRAAWVGKSFIFTMRAGHAPRVRIACLAPGSTRPGQGC
jgi:hypothetical protein